MQADKSTLKKVGPLIVCPASVDNWVVEHNFCFDSRLSGNTDWVTVRKNFITDFASIPRILWSLAPRWGDYGWAAILHDYMYWEQDRPRETADRIFLEAMERSHVPCWRRQLIFRAVRFFGCWSWESNRLLKSECGEEVRIAPDHDLEAVPFDDFKREVAQKVHSMRSQKQPHGRAIAYVAVGAVLAFTVGATFLKRRDAGE
jgi:uncharacterized protein DUF1353